MSAPTIRDKFGIAFTEDQMMAANATPPIWEINPPQREEYEDDQYYAMAVLEYANRVISFVRGPDDKTPLAKCLEKYGLTALNQSQT